MNERLQELYRQAIQSTNSDEYLDMPNKQLQRLILTKYAELVRQDEREANAKLADDFERLEYEAVGDPRVPAFKSLIGEAIRARGVK
jgi:hypothetical protein